MFELLLIKANILLKLYLSHSNLVLSFTELELGALGRGRHCLSLQFLCLLNKYKSGRKGLEGKVMKKCFGVLKYKVCPSNL